MKLRNMLAGVAAVVALSSLAGAAGAVTYTYVGSWEVDQGPTWYGSPPNGPLAYSGQEAAALLFGGSASNYVTSTVDSNVADINDLAWYSIIGSEGNQGNGGSLLADNYSDKYLGLYYGPTSGYPFGDLDAPASAYVADNAIGSTFTNYAFSVSGVPEPATWAMMLVGLGGMGAAMRMSRRTRGAAAVA